MVYITRSKLRSQLRHGPCSHIYQNISLPNSLTLTTTHPSLPPPTYGTSPSPPHTPWHPHPSLPRPPPHTHVLLTYHSPSHFLHSHRAPIPSPLAPLSSPSPFLEHMTYNTPPHSLSHNPHPTPPHLPKTNQTSPLTNPSHPTISQMAVIIPPRRVISKSSNHKYPMINSSRQEKMRLAIQCQFFFPAGAIKIFISGLYCAEIHRYQLHIRPADKSPES